MSLLSGLGVIRFVSDARALDRRKWAPGRVGTGTQRHRQGRECTGGLRAGARTKFESTLAGGPAATRKARNKPYEAELGRGLTMLTEQAMSG